jgi:hypothetical protein
MSKNCEAATRDNVKISRHDSVYFGWDKTLEIIKVGIPSADYS